DEPDPAEVIRAAIGGGAAPPEPASGPDPFVFPVRVDPEPIVPPRPAPEPSAPSRSATMEFPFRTEPEPDPDAPTPAPEPVLPPLKIEPPTVLPEAGPTARDRPSYGRARDVVMPRSAVVAWSMFVLLALVLAFVAGLLAGHFVWTTRVLPA